MVISAKPETLQVYTFSNSEEHYDQRVMKAPRNLKEDVSNKFPYLFLEKKVNRNKYESAYDTKPQIAETSNNETYIYNERKQNNTRKNSKQTAESYISESTIQTRRKPTRTGRSIHDNNVQPARINRRRGATNQSEHPNPGGKYASNINDKSQCTDGERKS